MISVRPLPRLVGAVFELLLLCFVVCISKKKKLQKHRARSPTGDGVLSNLFTMNIGPIWCAVFHVSPSFLQSFQHQTSSLWVLVLSPFFCISTKNKPYHERQTHLPWVIVFSPLFSFKKNSYEHRAQSPSERGCLSLPCVAVSPLSLLLLLERRSGLPFFCFQNPKKTRIVIISIRLPSPVSGSLPCIPCVVVFSPSFLRGRIVTCIAPLCGW